MNTPELEQLCKDLTYSTEYSFLECGKDDDELKKVAKKSGVVMPSPDLAIFKGKFAFTNRENLNRCTLPKSEVENSLGTLTGKAIDFDHLREKIVGTWLFAELIGNTIYAYGSFFKSNLEKDFEIVKDLMAKKKLCISFEAYGTRSFRTDGSYDLLSPIWAGGALLINTKPAFPGADVLEMSNKRVMEFASAMTEPTNFVRERSAMDELLESLIESDAELSSKLNTKDRNALSDDDFAVVVKKNGKKIRKFPIHDEAHVRAALRLLPRAKETLSKLGVNITTVKRKILARAKKLGMKELLDTEKAQFRSPEMDTVHRLMGEVKCPMCACQGSVDIDKIDFTKNYVEGKCWMCGSKLGIALTPDATFMPDDSIPDDNLTNSSIKVTLMKEENSMNNVIKTEGNGSEALAGKEEFKADANDTVVADDVTTDENTDAPIVECPTCGSQVKQSFVDAGPYAPSGQPDKSKAIQKSAPAKVSGKVVVADSKHLVPNAEGKVCCAKCGSFVTADAIKLAPIVDAPTGDNGDPSTLTKVLTDTNKPSGKGIPTGKENNVKSTNVPDKNTKNFANDQDLNIDKVPQGQLDDLKTLADVYNNFPKPSGDGKDASTITAAMVIAQIEFLKANARDEGKKIGLRRSLLGEFAKDMSDDDVLDETKFENASLKKEIADLKAGKPVVKETATVIVKKEVTPLEIGSKDKELSKGSEISEFAKKVRKTAFNV